MVVRKIKRKHRFISLSFSCPPGMERIIDQRTAELGFHSRSDYLRKLFKRDLELPDAIYEQPITMQ